MAAIVGVALVPLFVLLDLKDGGTGLGLCPTGFGGCRTSYFVGFEVLAGVLLVILALVLLIGWLVRLFRYLRTRSTRSALG